MPGLLGLFTSTDCTPAIEPDLVRPLVHEPFYSTTIKTGLHYAVCVIDNNTFPLLGGCSSRDGITAAFSGEFYNSEFDGAERSDQVAEILIGLYRKHGPNFPDYLEGSFQVFIADGSKALLFNDHVGSRQMFFSFQKGTLYFAPELKGILHHSQLDRAIDPEVFVQVLVNGALAGRRTWFRHIHSLLPGRVLQVHGAELTERQYFKYEPCGTGKDRGEESYVEELADILLQAVRRRMTGVERMVIPLSGGIDSRGILGCIHRLASGRKLTTVTWGTDESTPGADGAVARQIASLLGTDHHFIQRRNDDFIGDFEELLGRLEGLTDDVWMHHSELRTVQRIRSEFNLLGLWRGEECFGHWPRPVTEVAARLNSGYHGLEDHPEVQRIFARSVKARFLENSRAQLRQLSAECPVKDLTDRRDYWYYYERLFQYHTRGHYYKFTVLEVKNPWLDNRLIRFLENVPVHYRLERLLYKKALTRLFPELMRIPPARSVSLESWPVVVQRNMSIQKFVRHHLLETRNELHEWLDRNELEALVQRAFAAPQPSEGATSAGAAGAARTFLRKTSPTLFRMVKSMAGARIARFYPVPDAYIVLRLVAMKRWLDVFA